MTNLDPDLPLALQSSTAHSWGVRPTTLQFWLNMDIHQADGNTLIVVFFALKLQDDDQLFADWL